MKTIGEIERVSRSGWYFVKEPTFHIPCLLAVGRYSEADSELCVALEKVAGFEDVPKTIRTDGEDGVDRVVDGIDWHMSDLLLVPRYKLRLRGDPEVEKWSKGQ